jgi:hypothetical protein
MSKLEASLAPGGAHHFFSQLAGDWEGTVRTWFEPDVLADTSAISGSIRTVLGGRFALHEYSFELQGERYEALAILGFDLYKQRYTCAWVDSAHNGTTIMLSLSPEGSGPAPRPSVLGSYPDGVGGPDWGWRTEFAVDGPEHITIRHYNITPEGEEAIAVEIVYGRKA